MCDDLQARNCRHHPTDSELIDERVADQQLHTEATTKDNWTRLREQIRNCEKKTTDAKTVDTPQDLMSRD